MAKNPGDYSRAIIAKLAVTTPELSLALGTPERKIVDAVSEAIAEADVAQYLTGSLLDIETKSAMELEQFVGLWGFGRHQGRQASGVIRVELTTAAPQNMEIPIGSQFYTRAGLAGVSRQLNYNSTQAVVLTQGTFSVDVPVQCAEPGAQGNVPPDSVVALATMIGTASCTNLAAMTGGVDAETDDELRARFKDTMLRNVSGTYDWYRGLAVMNKFVSKVAVFGPTDIYRTQIIAPATSMSVPVNQDVKYVWPKSSSVFVNLGEEDQTFYNEVTDYTLSAGASPIFTRVTPGGAIPSAQVINLEFEYTPRPSRNDPANGIYNKVDVYVDGIDPYTVTERTSITDTTLSDTPGNELYINNFQRFGASGTPVATNRFMRLGNVPLVSFPNTLTVDGTTYTMGEHYWVLTGTTLDQGSVYEVAGIEWDESGPSETSITLNYTYNRLPQVLQAVMKNSKQITTDVMVHQAKYRYLKPNINVQFDRSYSVTQVTTAIEERLRSYYTPFPFGAHVKITDLLMSVRQVPGVANVSLTTSAQNASHYGVEVFVDSTDPTPASFETGDFKLDANMIPVFLSTTIRREATP